MNKDQEALDEWQSEVEWTEEQAREYMASHEHLIDRLLLECIDNYARLMELAGKRKTAKIIRSRMNYLNDALFRIYELKYMIAGADANT